MQEECYEKTIQDRSIWGESGDNCHWLFADVYRS